MPEITFGDRRPDNVKRILNEGAAELLSAIIIRQIYGAGGPGGTVATVPPIDENHPPDSQPTGIGQLVPPQMRMHESDP